MVERLPSGEIPTHYLGGAASRPHRKLNSFEVRVDAGSNPVANKLFFCLGYFFLVFPPRVVAVGAF